MVVSFDVLVVGASVAGMRTVTELREHGYTGSIGVIDSDANAPYDKPPLSKQVLGRDWELTDCRLGHFAELRASARIGLPAVDLEIRQQVVRIADGTEVSYGSLVIASGSVPRSLPHLEGRNSLTLRTWKDALAVRERLRSRAALGIIGGGLIGGEIASEARSRGIDVHVIEAADTLFMRALGRLGGQYLGDLHAERGVVVHTGVTANHAQHHDGRVDVLLSDGTELALGWLLIGIGARPCTEWLHESGLLLEDGVLCDQHLLAHGSASIYAVGDVCHYYDPAGSSYRRGENWTNAVEQAAVVATNLVSRGAATYAGLDYLWTHQCGRRIQAMGDLQSGEPEISARGPGHPDSWVLRTKDTEGVRGALAVNWPAAIAESRQLLVQRALKTHAAHQA